MKSYSILCPKSAHWPHVLQHYQICNITHCLQKALLQDLSSKEGSAFSILWLVRQTEPPAKARWSWRNIRFDELMQSSQCILNLKNIQKIRSKPKHRGSDIQFRFCLAQSSFHFDCMQFLNFFFQFIDLRTAFKGCLWHAVQHNAPV